MLRFPACWENFAIKNKIKSARRRGVFEFIKRMLFSETDHFTGPVVFDSRRWIEQFNNFNFALVIFFNRIDELKIEGLNMPPKDLKNLLVGFEHDIFPGKYHEGLEELRDALTDASPQLFELINKLIDKHQINLIKHMQETLRRFCVEIHYVLQRVLAQQTDIKDFLTTLDFYQQIFPGAIFHNALDNINLYITTRYFENTKELQQALTSYIEQSKINAPAIHPKELTENFLLLTKEEEKIFLPKKSFQVSGFGSVLKTLTVLANFSAAAADDNQDENITSSITADYAKLANEVAIGVAKHITSEDFACENKIDLPNFNSPHAEFTRKIIEETMQETEQLHKRGDYQEEIENYRKLLNTLDHYRVEKPLLAKIHLKLAIAELADGSVTSAQDSYQISQQVHKNVEHKFEFGRALYSLKFQDTLKMDFETYKKTTLELLENAYLQELTNEKFFLGYVDALIKFDSPNCTQIITKHVQSNPSAHTYFALAHSYYNDRNFSAALNAVNQALTFESSPKFYIQRGHIHWGLNDFQGALKDYQRASQLEPDTLTNKIYLKSAEFAAAQSVKKPARSALETLGEKGQAFEDSGDYLSAIAHYNYVMKMTVEYYPHDLKFLALTSYRSAICFYMSGANSQAVSAMMNSIQYETGDGSKHFELGGFYLYEKSYLLAASWFQQALDLQPDNLEFKKYFEKALQAIPISFKPFKYQILDYSKITYQFFINFITNPLTWAVSTYATQIILAGKFLWMRSRIQKNLALLNKLTQAVNLSWRYENENYLLDISSEKYFLEMSENKIEFSGKKILQWAYRELKKYGNTETKSTQIKISLLLDLDQQTIDTIEDSFITEFAEKFKKPTDYSAKSTSSPIKKTPSTPPQSPKKSPHSPKKRPLGKKIFIPHLTKADKKTYEQVHNLKNPSFFVEEAEIPSAPIKAAKPLSPLRKISRSPQRKFKFFKASKQNSSFDEIGHRNAVLDHLFKLSKMLERKSNLLELPVFSYIRINTTTFHLLCFTSYLFELLKHQNNSFSKQFDTMANSLVHVSTRQRKTFPDLDKILKESASMIVEKFKELLTVGSIEQISPEKLIAAAENINLEQLTLFNRLFPLLQTKIPIDKKQFFELLQEKIEEIQSLAAQQNTNNAILFSLISIGEIWVQMIKVNSGVSKSEMTDMQFKLSIAYLQGDYKLSDLLVKFLEQCRLYRNQIRHNPNYKYSEINISEYVQTAMQVFSQLKNPEAEKENINFTLK